MVSAIGKIKGGSAAVVILLVIAIQISDAAHWGYTGAHGQSHWCHLDKDISQCCGKQQSPINLDDKEVLLHGFPALSLTHYGETPSVMTISNNGHTVVAMLGNNDTAPTIANGGLNSTYHFASMHYHWGSTSKQGSEHTVNGFAYAGELHLVHYNGIYPNFATAAMSPNGLAVLGILLQVSEKDNPNLVEMIKSLSQVRYQGETAQMAPFPLQTLLPTTTSDFYRYQGSLTTPPCSEIVTWTVLRTPLLISEAQLDKFRALRGTVKAVLPIGEERLVDNYRAVQKLGDRKVYVRLISGRTRREPENAAVIYQISSSWVAVVALGATYIQFLFRDSF